MATLALISPTADLTTIPSAQVSLAASDGTNVGQLSLNSAGAGLNCPLTAIQGTAANPTLITTDTWHTVLSFSAGFSAGTPAPAYALEPTGTASKPNVRLRGQVLLTAAAAGNAVMFAVPYTFAQTADFVTPNNLSGYAAGNRVVRAAAGTGNIQCQPVGASTNFVILDGIVAPTS
jgi:hypothetical protein